MIIQRRFFHRLTLLAISAERDCRKPSRVSKMIKSFTMKKLIFTLIFFATTALASAQSSTYVNSYTKSDGTYVQGHYKTTSDNTNTNNYSTQGNTNSYTGQSGSKPKDYSSESSSYSADKNVQTGSRGGQYYINSNGNKTYVPKN